MSDVVPLGLSRTKPRTGTLLTLAGWGATSSINPTPATRLSTGVVQARTGRSATLDVVGYRPAPDTSGCLCDSGAPYFTTPTAGPPLLVSTESTGPDCPHSSPETTARVDIDAGWIRGVVPDLP